MGDSQNSNLKIGDWLKQLDRSDQSVTYLLPIELVEKIHAKYCDKFFSNDEYAFELSEFERRIFVDASALGQRVNGETLLQESPDFDFATVFEELGIQYVWPSDDCSMNKSIKLRRSALAYCGWLVQQEDFHCDMAAFKSDHHEELSNKGLPEMPDFRFPSGKRENTSSLTQAMEKLCSKWRLSHFATIELPMPLQPSLISLDLNQLPSHEGLIVYAMPDIFPFSGRGEIVDELDSHRRVSKAPHLRSWFELVHSSAREKKRFITFARRFQVQHYWRVLLSRHDQKIKGKKTALKELFAEVFNVSRDTMLEDFRKLEKLPMKLLEIPLEAYF